MAVKLATLDLGPAVWWYKFCTVPTHLALFVLFAQLQRSFYILFSNIYFPCAMTEIHSQKKKVLQSTVCWNFESPLKVLGRTCKGSSRRCRTFKSSTQNFFYVSSRTLAEEPFMILLRTIFLRVKYPFCRLFSRMLRFSLSLLVTVNQNAI